MPIQITPDLKLKQLKSSHELEANTHEHDESHRNDFEDELVPIFTFRKYNNLRGNHSSRGGTATINWPWFGNYFYHA